MDLEKTTANQEIESQNSAEKHTKRIKILGVVLTLLGGCLFAYLVYSVGLADIWAGITKIGFGGFFIILFIYFLRICTRAMAWKLSVNEPYKLEFKDTVPAVIIGEALSSMIPLGILMSGAAKAVAVRKKVPLVVGLSSVATENLFYSLVTGIFICVGAFAFLRGFELPTSWVYVIDFIIGFIVCFIAFGILMVIRQWHFASWICERLYEKGVLRSVLDSGRLQVRLFENLIYGFYRKHPKRFFPICFFQILFHLLGILEVLFILSRIGEIIPQFSTAFFLESISRLISIVFKLIPLVIGVDEAGSELVVKTLGIGAGIGVTLAIIRKGRILFWAGMGVLLIIKRGLSIKDIKSFGKTN